MSPPHITELFARRDERPYNLRHNPQIIPTDLNSYYTQRSDITFCESIMKNERITVPTTFLAEMKSIIQQGHLGIKSCKKRARESLRESLFWLLMNSEI